jgi:hypothetical protein
MLKGAIELETIKVVGISVLIAILGLLLKFGGIRLRSSDRIAMYEPFFATKDRKRTFGYHEKGGHT